MLSGGLQPPLRLDRAVYPQEAMLAGIQGNVIAKVVIDPAGGRRGRVRGAVVPLLDEARCGRSATGTSS